MQRRARQMRGGGLQVVEAVVERQKDVAVNGDDDRLILGREGSGVQLSRPGSPIGHFGPRPPLGDRLRVHTVAAGQSPQALLTMLDRATNRLIPTPSGHDSRGGFPDAAAV